MKKEFKEAIEDSPIIAAIKDDEGLKKLSHKRKPCHFYFIW